MAVKTDRERERVIEYIIRTKPDDIQFDHMNYFVKKYALCQTNSTVAPLTDGKKCSTKKQ